MNTILDLIQKESDKLWDGTVEERKVWDGTVEERKVWFAISSRMSFLRYRIGRDIINQLLEDLDEYHS